MYPGEQTLIVSGTLDLAHLQLKCLAWHSKPVASLLA